MAATSLDRYHIKGGVGYQRIFGCAQNTHVHPIQVVRSGRCYAVTIAVSETTDTTGIEAPALSPFEIRKTTGEFVLKVKFGAIKTETPVFTIIADEAVDSGIQATWNDVKLSRGDKLEVYGENLLNTDIDIFLEYA
jgi:hypothetical protein